MLKFLMGSQSTFCLGLTKQDVAFFAICKLFKQASDANSAASVEERRSVRVDKKKKVVRRWASSDVKALKMHSKARTPVEKVAKATKRTVGALRVKASQLGIGLGHRR